MMLANPILRDRRILAGLRIRDGVTGETIRRPLRVSAERLRFQRNRSGLFAVTGVTPTTPDETALAAHLDVFADAPATPADGSVTFPITVEDPDGRYVPAVFQLALPRGEALTEAVDIDLFPGPLAPVSPNWSGVRAALFDATGPQPQPLAGARLTIRRASDSQLLGTGFADRRGEVLAIAAGIPVIDFTAPANGGAGAPPPVGTAATATTIAIHTGPGAAWPPDPAAIDTNGQAWEPTAGTLPTPELRTGRLETAGLTLLLQPVP